MGQPRPLFHLFLSFQTHITMFTTNKCEKMSIQYKVRDSNSRPLVLILSSSILLKEKEAGIGLIIITPR